MARAFTLLEPVDAVRRAVLTAVAPAIRGVLVDRERRAALALAGVVAAALALTLGAPLVLLAVTPLFLGVPHLLVDVRYLVVQPRLHERRALALLAGGPLLVAAVAADPRIGLLAIVGAGIAARGSFARKAAVTGAGALAALASFLSPEISRLVIAHGHNVVAIGAVLCLSRSRAKFAVPLAAFVASTALLLSGGADAALADQGRLWGTSAGREMARLAGGADTAFGARLVLFFAFAQSVHYGAWLRVVPELARSSKTPRSFAQSARALVADVGVPLTLATIGIAGVLILAAALDARAGREAYFRFAAFHGYLELAAFALAFAERRGPTEPAS